MFYILEIKCILYHMIQDFFKNLNLKKNYFKIRRDNQKNSYERRTYESVDDGIPRNTVKNNESI